MLSGALSRNGLLISGVTISHALALLMLLLGSVAGENSSTPDTLMINLVDKSAISPHQQKSLATPQIKAPSDSENNSIAALNTASEFHTPSKSKMEAGYSAGGIARQAIHSPKPHYPFVSRRLREQGLVIARLCVSDQGFVKEVGITKSSGFEGLDRSALNALSQWRFSPSAANSMNQLSQCFQMPIQFTLEG